MEHNRQPEEIDKARRADAAARSASWRRADKMKQTCNLFGALVLVALVVVLFGGLLVTAIFVHDGEQIATHLR